MHDSCEKFPVRLTDIMSFFRYCSLVINVKVIYFGPIQLFVEMWIFKRQGMQINKWCCFGYFGELFLSGRLVETSDIFSKIVWSCAQVNPFAKSNPSSSQVSESLVSGIILPRMLLIFLSLQRWRVVTICILSVLIIYVYF